MKSHAAGMRRIESRVFVASIAVVFAPLFFQLDGRLFTDPATLEATRGAVTRLPLPISVLACAIATVLLLRHWIGDHLTLLLFATVPLMFLASIISGDGAISWPKTKLLLFQFGVPFAGFIVGRHLGQPEGSATRAGRCLLMVSGVLVLAQLTSSWFRHGTAVLSADVYGADIYGHLQYVPQVIIAAFLVGLFAAWDRAAAPSRAVRAGALVPLMAMYAAASMSMTAILGLWLGLFVLLISPYARGRRVVAAAMLIVAVGLSAIYIAAATSRVLVFQAKFLGVGPAPPIYSGESQGRDSLGDRTRGSSSEDPETRTLPNVSERFLYWKFFLAGSTESVRSFLFGHERQPDIRRYPSAHNYYLDFLYNFGVVALTPMLLLLAWTARQTWAERYRFAQSAALAGLLVAVVFLMAIDNGLKVGMRQPYPGIATFFLWGMLATRLQPGMAVTTAATERHQPIVATT